MRGFINKFLYDGKEFVCIIVIGLFINGIL